VGATVKHRMYGSADVALANTVLSCILLVQPSVGPIVNSNPNLKPIYNPSLILM